MNNPRNSSTGLVEKVQRAQIDGRFCKSLWVGEGGGLYIGIEDEEIVALADQQFFAILARSQNLLTSDITVSMSSPLLATSRHWTARCFCVLSGSLSQQRRFSVAWR